MELTRANLDSVFTGYNALFTKGMSSVNTDYLQFTTIVPSNTKIGRYPVMNLPSGMKKWIGERSLTRLKGRMLEIVNERYANGVEVNRDDLMFDHLGMYNASFTDLGINAANLWTSLAIKALAENPKWLDGENFFSASHVFGERTVINNLSTGAFSREAYIAARAAIMAYLDSTGDPLDLVPDLLVVGPSNEEKGKKVLEAELIVADGMTAPESNVYVKSAKLMVSTRLSGAHAGKWFLMVTGRGYKPVVVQKVVEGVLVRRDRDNDDCVFNRNMNEYGVSSLGAAAPTMPQLCFGGGFSE